MVVSAAVVAAVLRAPAVRVPAVVVRVVRALRALALARAVPVAGQAALSAEAGLPSRRLL